MAEYIRFVSYVFTYQGQSRGRNVGYVKFESRFGIKRILVSVNGVNAATPLDAYLMYKEQDTFVGIYVGTMMVRSQRGELHYATSEERFGQDECSVTQLCGMVLLPRNDSAAYLCTLWEDDEFDPERFVRSREELVMIPAAVSKPEEAEPLEQENLSMPEEPTMENVPGLEQACAEVLKESDILYADSTENHTEQTMKEGEKAELRTADPELWNWRQLCRVYPKVCPFPYEPVISCLRVKPGDIGRLPRDYWHLASNSFLLHSYYQYRYLLFFRIGREEEAKVFLGIPGTHTENEQFMAQMFGFTEFKPSPDSVIKDGGFGYWTIELTIMESEFTGSAQRQKGYIPDGSAAENR